MGAIVHEITDSTVTKGTFLLDTNILLWYTYDGGLYPTSNKPKWYQTTKYPDFVKKLLENDCTIYYSTYSLGELYHVLERIYIGIINERPENSDKEKIVYNKDLRFEYPIEKKQLDTTFEGMYLDIQAIATPLPLLENFKVEKLVGYISDYKLDAVDAMIYYTANRCGINNIVSDDSDFKNIENLNLYSANRYVCRNS